MVQVQDEFLEIIDSDRRLANDWQGLSNEEKQILIDNWQPEQIFDVKLMTSKDLGDFISTYNRVNKPEEEAKPEWFESKDETIEEIEDIPITEINKDNIVDLLKFYDKYSEEQKIKLLQNMNLNIIEMIQKLKAQSKGLIWRKYDTIVNDWHEVHRVGAKGDEGPLKHLFDPSELEREARSLQDDFDPGTLKELLKDWEEMVNLANDIYKDKFVSTHGLSILIRVANQIGKKTLSNDALVEESDVWNDLEEYLQDALPDHHQNMPGSGYLEKIFEKVILSQNKGFIQWAVLQELTNKEHKLFYDNIEITQESAPQYTRFDPETQYSQTQRITPKQDSPKKPFAQLSYGEETSLKPWELQLQTTSGRGSSSKAYNLPLYFIANVDIFKQHYNNLPHFIKPRVGDWVITCGKGVVIYWQHNGTKLSIFDNDNGAIINVYPDTASVSSIFKHLKEKYDAIKSSKESLKRWEDILETTEKLLAIEEGWAEGEPSKKGKQVIRNKIIHSIWIFMVGVRGDYGYSGDENVLNPVLNNIFNKATIEALKLEIIEEVKRLPHYREKIYINPILQFGSRLFLWDIAKVILNRIKDFSLVDNGHEYSSISLPEKDLPDNLIHELRKPEKAGRYVLLTTGNLENDRLNIDFDHINITDDKGEIILPLDQLPLARIWEEKHSLHEFEIEKLVHDIRQIIVNKTWEKFIERIE